jgi:hypothetical protein
MAVPRAASADWRFVMSVDTAPGSATATRTAVPLIASGAEALRAAREYLLNDVLPPNHGQL